MIGDPELKVETAYNMLPEGAGTSSQGRTPADNATVRSVFIIGPDKRIKAMLTYPMSTGRNFDEVLRLLDSCQLTSKHKVATPVNWKQGQDVIIVTAVSDDEAKKTYPAGFKTVKPYLRFVAQPKYPHADRVGGCCSSRRRASWLTRTPRPHEPCVSPIARSSWPKRSCARRAHSRRPTSALRRASSPA